MLNACDIDHILESDEFSPREKELMECVAKFIHHVVVLHSCTSKEFVELFNLCAKHELLEQLDILIKEYYKP